ncbi:cupredoxin domain-containing protein [Effusibacillus dendaii]|uniref:Cytochrome oxidase subunit II copper A binding domain-containing protein n=1 Tax=Effusibacillus dendaii TaxID=2743772 RepID=A0A7I8DG92_9BACL|nr:cupredoxin domain-containing protein [Effusibacillus dendaii]BCJ87896.1 hypothetical protein skT53_28810 [Effusibacillus dendaii]
MNKMATLLGIAVVSVGVLAGCGGQQQSASNNTSTSNNASTPAASSSQTSNASGKTSDNAATNAAEVKIVASNYKFDVPATEIKSGQPVKLVFSTKEGVHGFAIKDTNIKVDAVTAGNDKTVTWTPDKPGEYELYCSTMCGTGHADMHTKLVVK